MLRYPVSVVNHAKSVSGDGGSIPAQNSVGTNQIQNGSILLEDLSEEVLERLNATPHEGYTTDDDVADLFG